MSLNATNTLAITTGLDAAATADLTTAIAHSVTSPVQQPAEPNTEQLADGRTVTTWTHDGWIELEELTDIAARTPGAAIYSTHFDEEQELGHLTAHHSGVTLEVFPDGDPVLWFVPSDAPVETFLHHAHTRVLDQLGATVPTIVLVPEAPDMIDLPPTFRGMRCDRTENVYVLVPEPAILWEGLDQPFVREHAIDHADTFFDWTLSVGHDWETTAALSTFTPGPARTNRIAAVLSVSVPTVTGDEREAAAVRLDTTIAGDVTGVVATVITAWAAHPGAPFDDIVTAALAAHA